MNGLNLLLMIAHQEPIMPQLSVAVEKWNDNLWVFFLFNLVFWYWLCLLLILYIKTIILTFKHCCLWGLMFKHCCPRGLTFKHCCPWGLTFKHCCPLSILPGHLLTYVLCVMYYTCGNCMGFFVVVFWNLIMQLPLLATWICMGCECWENKCQLPICK